MFEFFLQVANATMPVINIPATLTPTFVQPAAAAATAADPLGIVALVSMALAAFNTYQSKKNDMKQSGRANALANTQIDMVDSQKATDQGVKDLSMGVNMTVSKLAENPNNKPFLDTPLPELDGKSITEYIQFQKDGWVRDYKAYYQDTTPKASEFNKDPVLAKTAAVQKLSTPS